MNLNNQQLSTARKRRGAFEGEVEEAGVILHGQNAISDQIKFVIESFLDPSINWGVKIGGASSLAVTSPEAHAIAISKGYGITRDINRIIVPNIPESWQGHRAVYTTENKWSLHPTTGDILLGTGTFYLSLAYKEHSEYMGAAIADYTPENVKIYENYFLRAGTDAPTDFGGTGADANAKGSDGSVGSNQNDLFLAKITKDGSGNITFESFTPKTITSVITSASQDVWTAHRRQGHINNIIAPFADRIDEDWGDASQNVNNSLKPTIDAVTDTLINFASYKSGTVIIIDGDEIPEPGTLSFDASSVLGSGDDGKTYFVYLDSAGAFGLLEETASQGLYNFPADKIPLGKFEWDWNGGSPLCVLPADDASAGTKGIWDERRFGTEGLKRFEWNYREGMVVMDAGWWSYENGFDRWFPGKASGANTVRWWAGDTKPKKMFMKYSYGTNSFLFECSVAADSFVTDGSFLVFNGGIVTVTGAGSIIKILSGGEIYVDASNYLNIRGILNSYNDLGTIEGIWEGTNGRINNLLLSYPEINGVMNWLTGGVNNFASSGVRTIFQAGGRLEVHDGGSLRLGGSDGTGAGQTSVTGAQAEKLINGSNADPLHVHAGTIHIPISGVILNSNGDPIDSGSTPKLWKASGYTFIFWNNASTGTKCMFSFNMPPGAGAGAGAYTIYIISVINKGSGSASMTIRLNSYCLGAIDSAEASSEQLLLNSDLTFVDGDHLVYKLKSVATPAGSNPFYEGQTHWIEIEGNNIGGDQSIDIYGIYIKFA